MSHKALVRIGLALVLFAFIGVGVWYWIHIHTFVSTDDAYVYGYMGVISARVPGRVAQVAVDDNQFIQPGQILLTLEPQDYEAAVAQAEGNLGRLRQDMAENYVKVATARAKLTEAQANFKLAGTDKVRYTALYQRRTVPKQTLDNVETRYRVNQALVDRYKHEIQQALAAIGGSTSLPHRGTAGHQGSQGQTGAGPPQSAIHQDSRQNHRLHHPAPGGGGQLGAAGPAPDDAGAPDHPTALDPGQL